MDDDLASEHAQRIDDQGWTLVDDAIDLDLVDALVEEIARLEQALETTPSTNAFEGRSTTRVYNLLARSPIWQQVPVHPSVLPIAERVLDPQLLISSLSSIAIAPGEAAQPIHADDQVIPLPRPHVPIVCNSMWALTDFTEANGATRIISGSHSRDHHPDYGTHYESTPAEMSKGSVLIWNGSLWHGGGANTTDSTRIGLAMNYCAGWIRQQENQQLGLAPSLVSTFEKPLARLVGYGTYNMLIGHIDKQTPAEALFSSGANEDAMLWDLK